MTRTRLSFAGFFIAVGIASAATAISDLVPKCRGGDLKACGKIEKELVKSRNVPDWNAAFGVISDERLVRVSKDPKASAELRAAIEVEQGKREARAREHDRAQAAMAAQLRPGMTWEQVEAVVGSLQDPVAAGIIRELSNGASDDNSGKTLVVRAPYTSYLRRCTLVFDGKGQLVEFSFLPQPPFGK